MFVDARSLESGTRLVTDVCIVGAGAAGISMARELIGSPFRVALLESGGLEYDPAIQDLADGENVGLNYSLVGARLRYFGGSLNHWGGTCRPLDAIDFEEREWIPYSGWPFGREHLHPFYERAHEVCRLGPFDYDPRLYLTGEHSVEVLCPLDEHFATKMCVYSDAVFGQLYRGKIQEAENVTTYLHATAVGLETDRAGRRVVRAHGSSSVGSFSVTAKLYVLAAGGLDNVRLLLLSDGLCGPGGANRHGIVGRYFMEHPCFNSGLLELWEPEIFEHYDPTQPRTAYGVPFTVVLSPSEGTLRRCRLANYSAWLWPVEEEELSRLGIGTSSRNGARVFRLSNHAEQAPNPSSRVTLGKKRDVLEQRRVRLDWRLTPADKDSVRRVQNLIAREVERRGLGRFYSELSDGDDSRWSPDMWGCHHHMGTTRMSEDPSRGVVDANCRVHGVSNLFIAGSSVFPTGGVANPTLTIVALALRLADHIKEIHGQPPLVRRVRRLEWS